MAQQAFYEQDEEFLAEPTVPGYSGHTSSLNAQSNSNAYLSEDEDFAPHDQQEQYQQYLDAHGLADQEQLEREQLEAQRAALELVPEEVKRFITSFHQAILNNDTQTISVLYDSGWNKLTHSYFSADAWPEAEVIAGLVGNDQVFLTLYRELYFRHVYARLEPNVDDRFNSYENICELFNLLLNSEQPVPLDLPVQWLWDMLDEFVYQFQSFGQWKTDVAGKSADELAILGESPQTWSCYSVLNVLYSLVQKAQINEQLAAERSGASPEEIAEIAGDFGSRPLYRTLGYFALICLLRVHVLLGDPTLALQTIQNIELNQPGAPHTKITACQVAVFYHVGIAFMSIGRFSDAIKTFIQVLVYFNRFKQQHTRSYQYNSVAKTCERMYALLAICTSVAPGPSDEGIMTLVKERHADQLQSLQRGGEDSLQIVRDLYLGACPKYISPISPPYEDQDRLSIWTVEPPSDPSSRQVDLLLSEVAAHSGVSATRSLLKLYTSVDASKLASFADVDEDALLEKMMNLKAASRTYGHKAGEGSLLDGERLVTNHFDFTIDRAMLHVAETTVDRRFAGFFIRNAEHAQRVLEQIRHAPLPITRPPPGAAPAAGQAKAPARGAPATRGGPGGKPAAAGGRQGGNPWGAVKA